jgi:hypothetical protein
MKAWAESQGERKKKDEKVTNYTRNARVSFLRMTAMID